MDDPKTRVERIFTLIADDYDQAGVAFFSQFADDLVEAAGIREGERVLDVGCGRGAVTFPAAAAVGASGHVEAIDISAGMVAALERDLGQRAIANVAARVGDAEAPGVPDHSFDAVLASLVLFFLPDVRAALRSYRAALKPGGRLAFTTFGSSHPDWEAIEQRLATYLPEGHPARSGSVRKPSVDLLGSPDAIRATLTDEGYTEIEVEQRVYPVDYETGERFVRFTQSTGLRAIWDAIPADRRAEAEADLAERADALRDGSGGLIEPVPIRLTCAVSP